MENVKIKYSEIVGTIGDEFAILINELNEQTDDWSVNLKKDLVDVSVFVDDEQSFVKRKDLVNNNIYIVVKFGNASTNFGSSVCPINLIVFGTKNKVKPVQSLLGLFVSRWNLKDFGNSELSNQVWATPSVISNFNSVGNAFESLFSVSGSIIIGESVVKLTTLTYITDSGEELPIDFLSINTAYDCAVSTQPFGNTFGFTKSEANFSSETFTFSTYLLNNQFVADCLNVQGFRPRGTDATYASSKGPNDTFKFIIKFSNGFNNQPKESEQATTEDNILGSEFFMEFKLRSVSINQRVGELPSLTVAFTH